MLRLRSAALSMTVFLFYDFAFGVVVYTSFK